MVHNVISFLGVCVLGGGGGGGRGGSRRQGKGRVAGTGKEGGGGGGDAENRSVLSCRMFYALCLH